MALGRHRVITARLVTYMNSRIGKVSILCPLGVMNDS